jgi:hypothetical protein
MATSIDFDVFWAEMSPCEHFVQIYEDDAILLDALDGFVGGGLRSGESSIVIATPAHREALEQRLRAQGLDVGELKSRDQYIALDAAEVLSQFMKDGWPDDARFHDVISGLLKRAKHRERRVRAFGEMVALLWAEGHAGATVRLEYLWHGLCRAESFSLFCAYPRIGGTQDPRVSLQDICAVHTKLLGQPPPAGTSPTH